jgi:hypothetical protein
MWNYGYIEKNQPSLSGKENHSNGGVSMDLHTLKFGLLFAACMLTGIFLLFVAYWKMGQITINKHKKRTK